MPRTHIAIIAGFGILLIGFITLLTVGCDPGPVTYDETTLKALTVYVHSLGGGQ